MVWPLASVSLPMMERLMGSLKVLVMPKRMRSPQALALESQFHPP
jgi:hypothetical protein